jgi:hypothetical protein
VTLDPLSAKTSTGATGYRARLGRVLTRRQFTVVGILSLLISTQLLFRPHLFEMWTLADVALAWAEYFIDVLSIGFAMLIAVAMVEQAPVRRKAVRALLQSAALVVPAVAVVWLIAWRQSGRFVPAAPLGVIGEAMKYSLLGAFVFGVRALHHRAVRANQTAHDMETARDFLEIQVQEAQLQLLQAQIEPHFLFNTLANVRRLYRTQPSAGAIMIDNLMVYLRAALPQVRRSVSTLAEEFELVQAYLELFKVRMGARLRYTLDLPPGLRGASFPPMVLVTLAENAIKHGLAPADLGGTLRIAANREGASLEVTVTDNGVGFDGASAGGTGVGLVNIRRQLAARYGDQARLTLEQVAGGGVRARIVIPVQADAARLPVAAAAET